MKVLEGHKSDIIKNAIQDSIDEESIVFTDKANTYLYITDHVEFHISEKCKHIINCINWLIFSFFDKKVLFVHARVEYVRTSL